MLQLVYRTVKQEHIQFDDDLSHKHGQDCGDLQTFWLESHSSNSWHITVCSCNFGCISDFPRLPAVLHTEAYATALCNAASTNYLAAYKRASRAICGVAGAMLVCLQSRPSTVPVRHDQKKQRVLARTSRVHVEASLSRPHDSTSLTFHFHSTQQQRGLVPSHQGCYDRIRLNDKFCKLGWEIAYGPDCN